MLEKFSRRAKLDEIIVGWRAKKSGRKKRKEGHYRGRPWDAARDVLYIAGLTSSIEFRLLESRYGTHPQSWDTIKEHIDQNRKDYPHAENMIGFIDEVVMYERNNGSLSVAFRAIKNLKSMSYPLSSERWGI